jgi:hypothetical protein
MLFKKYLKRNVNVVAEDYEKSTDENSFMCNSPLVSLEIKHSGHSSRIPIVARIGKSTCPVLKDPFFLNDDLEALIEVNGNLVEPKEELVLFSSPPYVPKEDHVLFDT